MSQVDIALLEDKPDLAPAVIEACASWQTEFALACWDSFQGRLILARDSAGAVPLYYLITDSEIVFSTQFKDLLPFSQQQIDVAHLATCAAAAEDLEHTCYKDIKKVPPGSYVDSRSATGRPVAYWHIEAIPAIGAISDRECESRTAALIERAVSRRLKGTATGFALSGGWDSSCLLAAALTVADPLPFQCPTYSYVYDISKTSDERRYIEAAAQHFHVKNRQLAESDYPFLSDLAPAASWLLRPTPSLAQFSMLRAHSQACHSDEVATIISGFGGDQLFLSGDIAFPVAALGQWRRPVASARQLMHWSAYLKKSLHGLAFGAVAESRWFGGRVPAAGRDYPEWLSSSASAYLHQIAATARQRVRRVGVVQARRIELAENAIRIVAGGYSQDALAPCRVSYPYCDRDVLEFLVAVPATQLLRPKEWRSLQARVFSSRLPKAVASRTGKRGPGEAVVRAVAAGWTTLERWFRDSRCKDLGLVGDKFDQYLMTVKHGNQHWTGHLMWMIALEAWLRQHESHEREALLRAPRARQRAVASSAEEEVRA